MTRTLAADGPDAYRWGPSPERCVSPPDLREQLQSTLGAAYTLERELGGGGMSRVFVAEETALGRRVAVKVLHPDLAGGVSGDRFKREVRLAARLQHPHIVPLLAAGALADGALYYTMPFVEGEGLADRLAREGALPVAEAISLLRDVASALAYAHRHQVVHRDVKPGNVLLSDGAAIVTDFGIAKAISGARHSAGYPPQAGGCTRQTGSEAERRVPSAESLTIVGTSLGTPAYMAPEQALGDVVDHRADIYALGVVAYELLSGRPPFEGRTAQQLLAAHATEAPEPLSRRRPSVPPGLAALVMRCLEKGPADRPQSADEVCRALETASGAVEATTAAHFTSGPSVTIGATRPRLPWIIAGLATAMAAVALGALLAVDRAVPALVGGTVTSIEPPPGNRFLVGGAFALSPDGSRLAFVAQGPGPQPVLWVRALDSLDATPIRDTEGANFPFWSPDGASLGFFAGGQLTVVEASGGNARTLCAAPVSEGGSWGVGGVILFAPGQSSPIHQVADSGGTCARATRPDSARGSEQRPSFLPDGRHFVFSTGPHIHLGDLVTGETWPLRRHRDDGPGGSAAFAPPDLVVYQDGPAVYAQRLDVAARRLTGEPRRIADRVTAPGGTGSFSVSQSGSMVAHVAPADWMLRRLVRLDRRANVVDTGFAVPTESGIQHFRYSRRGDRVAFAGEGLFVHDVARDVATRLATGEEGKRSSFPLWSPGDSMLAYAVAARRLKLHRFGRDTTEVLYAVASGTLQPSDWSADGRHIAFSVREGGEARTWALWVYSFDDRTARPLLPADADVRHARFSPDGRWVAYVSEKAGIQDVYLRPFSASGAPTRVSAAGGTWPRWGRDGRELFYSIPDGTLMAVSVRLGDVPVLGAPLPMGRPAHASRPLTPQFEVTPDGGHFALLSRREDRHSLILITNWPARMRKP